MAEYELMDVGWTGAEVEAMDPTMVYARCEVYSLMKLIKAAGRGLM